MIWDGQLWLGMVSYDLGWSVMVMGAQLWIVTDSYR